MTDVKSVTLGGGWWQMVAVHSSKMSEKMNLTTWYKIPTDSHHLNNCHENVTAYINASCNT
jgi:hypothetical protein